jgi:hypothetical protein
MDELKLYVHGALAETTSKEAAIEHGTQLESVLSKAATRRRRIEMKIAHEKHRRHVPPPPSWGRVGVGVVLSSDD